MTWSNERDVKPSEEVVDSDAWKRWTAILTVRLAYVTAMPTGVGFSTSSAEARKAAALELMGKPQKPLLRSDGVKRNGDDLLSFCRRETRSVLCSSCARAASDVGVGKVLYNVPFRDTWLAAGVHTFYFTVCERRVLSAEHQIWFPRVPQRPVQGSSSIARIVQPVVTRRIVRHSET